jgi:CBS-domain-containing membrane protein
MSTRRFTYDANGKKIYIGSIVIYKNRHFLVEDMEYLSWNREHYITLVDKKNKNKIVRFISPKDVMAARRKNV